jgi:hypothetical protein
MHFMMPNGCRADRALLVSLETCRDKGIGAHRPVPRELGAVLRGASDLLIQSKIVQLPGASGKMKARRRQLASGKVVELDINLS